MAAPSSNLAYRGRFAPSPTGPLHLGSLCTAMGSWLLARQASGRWMIRIEDLDLCREVPDATRRQLQTLAAFGLESDETILHQTLRCDAFQAALEQLLASGDAFICHCTRSDLASGHGVHRHCVAGAPRRNPSVRFRVLPGANVEFDDAIQGPSTQDVATQVGDFVLKRADGPWAYQLAVVVDDAAQEITDIARGADLLDSTPRQILLQRALGLPTPRYAHLPLIVDPQGRKLSKSFDTLPVSQCDPLPALRACWQALGQPRACVAGVGSVDGLLSAALAHFDPQLIPPRPQAAHALETAVRITGAI